MIHSKVFAVWGVVGSLNTCCKFTAECSNGIILNKIIPNLEKTN